MAKYPVDTSELIRFDCSTCRLGLFAKLQHKGKTTNCPKCGGKATVPPFNLGSYKAQVNARDLSGYWENLSPQSDNSGPKGGRT
jgi:hypothetical protein